MIGLTEGYRLIAGLATPLDVETVALEDAVGRVLRAPLRADRAQPAQDISAMDGYALAGEAARYTVIGEVAAEAVPPSLQPGQAVRIFTGAGIPEGADRILIQENAHLEGAKLHATTPPYPAQHIRRKGIDFDTGFTLEAPRRITPAEIALIAAMNHAEITVTRPPCIAIIATGSELVAPGGAPNPYQTIASNAYGIRALARDFGARADILPIVEDRLAAITAALNAARDYDLIVTTGGASVGKYDFARQAAEAAGFDIAIHKIALRPGKPVLAGRRGEQILLGLPGNPVSALIGARLFLRALVDGLLGLPNEFPSLGRARLGHAIAVNGDRTHLMRAQISDDPNGAIAHIEAQQDSALLSVLAKTNALVMRTPFEPAKQAGDWVDYLRF